MPCYCTGAPAHPHCYIHSQSVSFSIQEEQNRGKPNWEHLNEDLHVLITVEDTQARAEIKMRRAVEEVKKLLVPAVSLHPRIRTSHMQREQSLMFSKCTVI